MRIVGVLVLTILASNVAFLADSAARDVRAEITSLLNEYFLHRNNADFKYFEDFYTPDVITVYSGKLADGRQALTQTVGGFIESETERSTEIEDLIVTPRKNIVWVRYTMHNTSVRSGTKQDSRLFTTMAFEKQAGQWRCFFVSAAPIAQASESEAQSGSTARARKAAATLPPSGVLPPGVELHDKIQSLLKEYFVHRNNGDLQYFEHFYTPAVATVHSGTLADGRKDLIQTLRGFIEGREKRHTEIEDLVIDTYDNTVWARYVMHNKWMRDGTQGSIRVFTTMSFEQTGPNQFRAFTVAAAPRPTMQD